MEQYLREEAKHSHTISKQQSKPNKKFLLDQDHSRPLNCGAAAISRDLELFPSGNTLHSMPAEAVQNLGILCGRENSPKEQPLSHPSFFCPPLIGLSPEFGIVPLHFREEN